MSPTDPDNATSIVIPAHNEQSTIARLLSSLTDGIQTGEFEIIVVCNGCTDATASIASTFGPEVHVIETPRPSKRDALTLGDSVASHLPRVYIDADVEIGCADVRTMLATLGTGQVLATAPKRVIPREGVGPLARGYYDIWERLPQVREGLFARGVIAVSAAGYARISRLPSVMSDDLAMSEAFAPGERGITNEAAVVIHPARTLQGLIKRRTRVNTGNAQLDRMGGRSTNSRTTKGSLLEILRREPKMTLRLPVFLGITVVSRLAARRRIQAGDFDTWLRDDSSRDPAARHP